ncbi:hypothetical protein BDF20DRAFT_915446 [Mycotypha africana]|uniref:uncharacterized protein n=1 Tax=Mycotypha africana TaxID=64632 RepID=UPI00230094D7|nr:uncharacterized protein BDF20DRAFT_915446 [Mycotypha africana]KAI8971666.1 hypothetical protein BDF20DRAFT_915446 [Mycotypha africana]
MPKKNNSSNKEMTQKVDKNRPKSKHDKREAQKKHKQEPSISFLLSFIVFHQQQMTYTKEYKELVNFEYPCYICGTILSRPKICIDHVRRVHGYELPVRGVGQNRPSDPVYEFQNNPNGEYDVQHYACPSCWYHCPETGLRELKQHTQEEHHPKIVDSEKAAASTTNKEPTAENKDEDSGIDDDEESMDQDREQSNDMKGKQKIEGNVREEVNEAFRKLNEITEMFKNLLRK